MNDDEIRLMREEAASGESATARLFVELADEALARSVSLDEAHEATRNGTRQIHLLQSETHDLRERVAQLETALLGLRFGNLMCWCPCGPAELGQHDRACEQACAALNARKP